MSAVSIMDENDQEIKSPIKRVGSTRKILVFNNIRQQLNEQLRCLDTRVESQVSIIQELQDFFRRRGELELDYSKSLDKFGRTVLLKHKEQKQKREQWPIFSTYTCWQHLVKQTQTLSKDHAILSDLYSGNIVSNLQNAVEDVQRIYKKCRTIAYEIHEEILRLLQELHATMKTYQRYESECQAAESKLNAAETQRMKLQQNTSKDKLERSKKYKLTEKEVLKRSTKYADARLKALRAKNEYQLCLEASNMTIHKFFVEDLGDLIDCMDLGFGSTISRAILMHVTADQARSRTILKQSDVLSHLVHSIDCRADKQKFFEQHHGAFMVPKQLDFQGPIPEDSVAQDVQKAILIDMEQRLQMLEQRLSTLRTESDEIWKTLETAEAKLLEHLNAIDFNTSELFANDKPTTPKVATPFVLTKVKADKQEIEDFYISKIREYIKGTSRIARLDAKAEFLRNVIANEDSCQSILQGKQAISKRKRIGRSNIKGQPKLFGGSLEEYLELTGEEIPLILKSCIRVINLYGLHHQGIFRVSGSQVEISNFRELFERGEDPLADMSDASDINSVAGVLKLYLRELREPLFPIIYFDYFVSIAELQTKDEVVQGIRKFLQSLPRPIVIVLRYLFSFLNHLSEFADENMMDAYNLAICFGPTLIPAPEDKDQVQYQNQVNELIKNMILYHDELFPKDLGGFEYEKYISHEPFIDIDVGDSPIEVGTEYQESETYPSEDESEVLEAVVQFDFNARSSRELTLRRGEYVILRKQVSNDWWQGVSDGKEGLIPDKYISLKMKDDDRDKTFTKEVDIAIQYHSDDNKLCPKAKTADSFSVVSDCADKQEVFEDEKLSDSGSTFDNTSENKHTLDIGMRDTFVYHDVPHSFELEREFENKYEEIEMLKHVHKKDLNTPATEKTASNQMETVNADETLSLTENPNRNAFLEEKSSFQQNKKLWEELSVSGSSGSNHLQIVRKQQRAPDLVMDLPGGVSPENKNSSLEGFDEEMTSAERFATQNISTLKKNIRYFPPESNMGAEFNKSSTSDENILVIRESPYFKKDSDDLDAVSSNIPNKNTQKIASHFKELNLTGGYKLPENKNHLAALRHMQSSCNVSTTETANSNEKE